MLYDGDIAIFTISVTQLSAMSDDIRVVGSG
jgi:hypothetical protein